MPVNADDFVPGATLSGKVVLLAGATGTLGTALARELRRRGARLGIAVRRRWQVTRIAEALGSEDVLIGCVGATDSEAAAGLQKGVHDSLGPIDAFLCTTGAFRFSMAGRDPSGEVEELFEANVLAPMSLTRAVIGPMKRRRTGSLVFTGAAAVQRAGGSGMSAYLASKAALHEYARVLAEELEPDGIRVAVVTPEIIDTPANRESQPTADRVGWQSVERVVDSLIACAFGPARSGGPLFPVEE